MSGLAVRRPALFLDAVPEGSLGFNAYYLQEEAARSVRLGEARCQILEEVLAKATRLGVKVLRTNGYNAGASKVDDSAIQLAPGRYDEIGFRGLDRVLARAAAHGVKLVVSLGNHWDAYGGARRFTEWAGFTDAKEGDSRFYASPDVRALYRESIETLLTRVNTEDGLPYASHPSVLLWELVNEGRGDELDPDGDIMRDWVDEIGRTVRTLAPQGFITTGEEGFSSNGTNFAKNTASPYVDVASIHLYPESWGWTARGAADLGVKWMESHARTADKLKKPLFVGEFGLRNDGGFKLDQRRMIYTQWLEAAAKSGIGLVMPWMLAHDSRPERWDDYSFYVRDGLPLEDAANRYADIFALAQARRDEAARQSS